MRKSEKSIPCTVEVVVAEVTIIAAQVSAQEPFFTGVPKIEQFVGRRRICQDKRCLLER